MLKSTPARLRTRAPLGHVPNRRAGLVVARLKENIGLCCAWTLFLVDDFFLRFWRSFEMAKRNFFSVTATAFRRAFCPVSEFPSFYDNYHFYNY